MRALQVQTPKHRYEQFACVLHICATCMHASSRDFYKGDLSLVTKIEIRELWEGFCVSPI